MIRSKSIAIVVAAAGIAVAGSVALAQEAGQHSPPDRHQADGAHKQHQEHGHGMQDMQARQRHMADMHKHMAEMHEGMAEHGRSEGEQRSKKPETEEHKH